MKKKNQHQKRETAPPYVLGMTQIQTGKQRFSHFLQFPQKLTFVFVDKRQLKSGSMALKQIQLTALPCGPVPCDADAVLPSQPAHVAPSSARTPARHTALPQACQHPSTAEGNAVCGVFGPCIILWFVRATGEPMKCIHVQR